MIKNSHNIKARGLKAVILRKLNRVEEAKARIKRILRWIHFDYISRYEESILENNSQEKRDEMNGLMRDFQEAYLQAARDYAEAGFYTEAAAMLSECTKEYPMLAYYKGFYLGKLGKTAESVEEYKKADGVSPLYCFPNGFTIFAVLLDAISSIRPEQKHIIILETSTMTNCSVKRLLPSGKNQLSWMISIQRYTVTWLWLITINKGIWKLQEQNLRKHLL